MRLVLSALLLGAGCNAVFGIDPPDPIDGAIVDASLGAFSAPNPIAGLNTSAVEDDPTLTEDLLEIYFDSNRIDEGVVSMGDVWVAKRARVTDGFDAPVLVAELASAYDDTSPEITPDGLRMYLSSARPPSGDRDLYFTSRADRSSQWEPPMRLIEVSAPGLPEHSAVETLGGTRLFFNRDNDVWMATRATSSGPWLAAAPVQELNTTDVEGELWVDQAATTIYFTSNRNSTHADLWFATRPDADSMFGPPERVPSVNSTGQDLDPWLSQDQRVLVFARGPAPSGAEDLYITTR